MNWIRNLETTPQPVVKKVAKQEKAGDRKQRILPQEEEQKQQETGGDKPQKSKGLLDIYI